MKTNLLSRTMLAGLLATAGFLVQHNARAVIVGPYSPDANTLHLWHMDSGAVPVPDAVPSGGTNLVSLLNGAALDSPSYVNGTVNFGSALNTLDGGQDSLTEKNALITGWAGTGNPGNISITLADPTSGAFTFEALVWIGFDPAKNFGTTANGGNNRNTPFEIMSGESSSSASRIFQFRILPVGMDPDGAGPAGLATVPLLTFENVRQASGAQTLFAAIPTSGTEAIASNAWYHVAVTYNGIPNTAGNTKFYWTRVESAKVACNEIAITSPTTMLSGLNPRSTAVTPFIVGNEGRTRAANFLGLIDEVRISNVARGAGGMLFGVPNVAIDTQPASQYAIAGETVRLSVVASGEPPFSYQWRFNNADLPTGTDSTLVLPNISSNEAGSYQVVVANSMSSATSAVAVVRVGLGFNELFNTGVDASGAPLTDGAMDLHWQLVQSADPGYPGPSAFAVIAPPGAWMPNGPSSAWTAPNSSGVSVVGTFIYRTTFFLDTLDASTAQLAGNWVADNLGLDVILNGNSLGLATSGMLAAYSPFLVTSGFVPGLNTLDLVVTNPPGTGINYTGLRAELRGVAMPLPPTAPQMTTLPVNVTTQAQQSASFTAVAIGSAPLAYQWYRGATPLAGQTRRTLALTGLKPADAGTYTVVVTNSLGSANASAALTVITPPLLAWLGLTTGDWDTSTINWLDTGLLANVAFSPYNDVLFDSRGSGVPSVNLAESLRPNSIVVDADTDYTFDTLSGLGAINGNVLLTKRGNGTLTLNVTNNSSGTTVVEAGTLQVGNGGFNGSLGSGAVSNNATLAFNRFDAITVPNPISGSGTVMNPSSGYLVTLSGSISGGQSLVNLGSGMILTASNSFTGPTTVSAGTVNVRNGAALGATASGTTVAYNGQLYIDANVNIGPEPLSLSGFGPDGSGALRKGGNGATTYAGPITLAESASIKLDGNATLNLTNTTGVNADNFGLSLLGDGGSQGILNGPAALGSGALTKDGAGTWVLLSTNNNWSGGTFINAGTLQFGNGIVDGNLPPGTILDNGALAFASPGNLVLTHTIEGSGGVHQLGSGTLTLAAVNTHTGTNRINGTGALRPGNNQALGTGTVVIGAAQTDTSRLELLGGITLNNVISIFPRAFYWSAVPVVAPDIVNVSGINTLGPPAPITIDGGGNLLTLQSDSGKLILNTGVTATGAGRHLIMSGAGDGEILGNLDRTGSSSQYIWKLDSGTWTLWGANSPGAATTISNGVLVLNGSLDNVLTNTGGTLAGTGVISGAVYVNSGATLAPGPSIGTLTINSTLALQPGSITSVELHKSAGLSDRVTGLTSVSYGGTLALTNLSGTLAAGDAFKLFDATSYSGSFANIVPASPGTDLVWNTNTLASDGMLRVSPPMAMNPTNITAVVTGGNTLEMSWPADHTGWILQGQTNASGVGLTATWFNVPNTSITNRVFMPIDPAAGSIFYRLVSPF